jgi:MFS transporter, SHS family, lactate transporter
MATGFIVYYSIFGLFATYLTHDLHLSPAEVGWPLVFTNAATFVASFFWGWLAGKIGRRWAMIIPELLGLCLCPIYLLTTDLHDDRHRLYPATRLRRGDVWSEP